MLPLPSRGFLWNKCPTISPKSVLGRAGAMSSRFGKAFTVLSPRPIKERIARSSASMPLGQGWRMIGRSHNL